MNAMIELQQLSRRAFLRGVPPILGLIIPGISSRVAASVESGAYPAVIPGPNLSFPRDHGAHPDYRTEWWYLTARLESSLGPLGLQITFFRSRTPYGRNNPSRFAPKQLILAHAALAIPEQGSLLHAQQAWRSDAAVAQISITDTDIAIGLPKRRWSMVRNSSDQYIIQVKDDEFQFNITATPPTSISTPVLQGDQGYSQKGQAANQASYYYSRPQLHINGEYQIKGVPVSVSGTGWLDHEWSSELLDQNAAGWDWVGLNFHDGSALMAFQMRSDSGDVLYTAARHISLETGERIEHDYSAKFSPLRYWQSSRTDGRYPVSTQIKAGGLDLTIEPLLDDQELDSRTSTGVIYWEGAVNVWHSRDVNPDGSKKSEPIATGYLELTGYAGDLTL